MGEYPVVVAGGGPTGMLPAAEPALTGVGEGSRTGLDEALDRWFG
jgi:2-polyprenyl-6-methoxyphenol hydroxylase-like FAD-dependent oxidoreductase